MPQVEELWKNKCLYPFQYKKKYVNCTVCVFVFIHTFEYIDIKKPCLYKTCMKQPICQTLKRIKCPHQRRRVICIYIYTCTERKATGSWHTYYCTKMTLRTGFYKWPSENSKDVIVGINWHVMLRLMRPSIGAMTIPCPSGASVHLTILSLEPNCCNASC